MISLVPSSLLWFPPFHFTLFFFFAQTGSAHPPTGEAYLFHCPVSISLPAPQLFPFLQAPLLLRAPSTSSPFPPSLEVNNRENRKRTRREIIQPRMIILRDAKYCLTSVSLDRFHLAGWAEPTISSTDTLRAMFHATQSVIEEF